MSASTESSQPQEHAVFLEWADSQPPLEFIFAVEDQLRQVINAHPGLGEVDGNEVGSGTAVIYLYGPNAETLWQAIEPTVRALQPAPTTVIVRPGEPGTPSREIMIRT
ncbi:hypothetical protein A5722_12025 [Mycobacterium vulneris]|nr:hypothetical protein A5722_12025 [Mycolicibacterium vulneris]OCB62017.1 hypothetical protein A5729_27905 [Mycolicibacterium vulneris]